MALDAYRCIGCGRFFTLEALAPGVRGCPDCGQAIADGGAPQAVSLAALREAVRRAPVPLLVEFWASDCEPCLASAVVLDAVSHRLAGEAVVLRIDVEENPEACEAYGVLAVPTVVLFSAGRERGRRVGPLRARAIEEWVHTDGRGPLAPGARA